MKEEKIESGIIGNPPAKQFDWIMTDEEGNEYKVTEKGDISLSDTFRLEFKKYLESKGADTTKMDREEMNIAFTCETMKGFFDHIKLKYG